MTARANWFLELPDEPEGPKVDPLDSPVFLGMLDIKTPEPKLERMMTELVEAEASLFDQGITCGLRDLAACCSTCPLFGVDSERRPLCGVGKEQEQVASTLLAKMHGP